MCEICSKLTIKTPERRHQSLFLTKAPERRQQSLFFNKVAGGAWKQARSQEFLRPGEVSAN